MVGLHRDPDGKTIFTRSCTTGDITLKMKDEYETILMSRIKELEAELEAKKVCKN